MESRQKFLFTLVLIVVGIGLTVIVQINSLGKLRLIFCDVGQGDGILIVTPAGEQIVVDGGPGKKIVECLAKYMPFWDRKVEMMVLTHPQKDHMEGQVEIFARYKVERVVSTGVKNETDLYKVWGKSIANEKSDIAAVHAGQTIVAADMMLDVLWPSSQKLDIWKLSGPKDLNDSSIVLRMSEGQTCAYLTGDLPKELLEPLITKPCQILKISHHGSKTGTSEGILDQVQPQIAVIQVGKNSFGHPHQEVIDILEKNGVRILRNDQNGTIELEFHGQGFKIR